MKKVLVLISLVGLLLVGCNTEISEAKNTEVLKIKKDVLGYGDWLGESVKMYTYIITDKETDNEYIVVKTDNGLTITPRLK